MNLSSNGAPLAQVSLVGREPSRLVQPQFSILVLFYDQAKRIYSLTRATGAIRIHQWEPRSMQTAQIANTEIGVPHCLAFCG